MRRGPGSGVLRAAPLLALLALTRCRREEPPPLPPPPAQAAQDLDPWSFHFVGGLLVITGETADDVQVTLKGPTLNETRTLPFGPIRWELLRPPPHEVAELRTKDGKLLMLFNFDKEPPPRTRTQEPVRIAQAEPSRPAPPPLPARPAPAPVPPPVLQAAPARPGAPPAPGHPRAVQAAPPAPPARAAHAAPAPVPAPPRPAPVPVAPTLAPSRPARALAAGPVRPAPAPIPPPRPAPAPRPALPAVPAPPPPAPAMVPPPNPKVPPRPVLMAKASTVQPVPVQPAPARPVVLPTGAWPGSGEGLNLLRGPKGQRRICMTFDGGSTCEVAVDVLDALKARGIHTTIFLTGEFIRKYPDLVRRMAREGHELGNHTLNHPHFAPGMRRDPQWTRERVQQELLDADRELYKLLGRPFDPYWRAPFGEQTPEIRKWAEELGYRTVGWSEGADTLDWATTKERRLYRTGDAILDKLRVRMEKQDGDGLIVLMHLGSERPSGDRPAQVLGPFLDRAIREGWHFVSIGDYVNSMGKPKWEPVRRVALLR